MTSSVVVTSFLMRSRNFDRAENKATRETSHTIHVKKILTRNKLVPHIPKQRATVLFALRVCSSFITLVVVELREDKNEGH